jgi:hypothetical protein
MGQFSESLLPGAKEKLGISGEEHDAELLGYGRQAQAQIELLTGHRLEGARVAVSIDHGGLPFVATLDTQSATMQVPPECWPIVDPVHPEFANVLQAARAQNLADHAVGKAEALWAGAAVLAAVHRNGWLKFAPRVWFAEQSKAGPTVEFARRLMDPGRHTHVPVVSASVEGWWIQMSRRICIVTKDTPDDPGLVEMLAPPGQGMAVVAGEPILVVARMTQHPSDWAFVARVWVGDPGVRTTLAWRADARAIHGHGLPIITLDEQSTPEEVVAQTLLAAYWHGYIDGDEATPIPVALAAAFPRDVERVRRGTGASGTDEAGTALFRRLLRPGFDPTRGAGSIRRYITRHATTLVREHRSETADSHPWQEFEIEERHYYKLLARFANRDPSGRYVLDDAVKAKITSYLADSQQRKNALELLRLHGFGEAAARKHLRRHGLDGIATSQPRRPRVAVWVG